MTAQWHRLKTGTGGIVTGIQVHSDGTMVQRTDSGGAYIWNATADQWDTLLKIGVMPAGTSPHTGGGCDEIRMAPSNSSVIWMLQTGKLYKSVDKGLTFALISSFPVNPGTPSAWSPTKAFGPFISIDPNNVNLVYVSTTLRGCYRTLDGGATWAIVGALSGGMISNNRIRSAVALGTDTTTNTVGLGSKTFSTHGAAFTPPVHPTNLISVNSPGDNQSMVGVVTASTSSSFTMTVVAFYGSGTFSSWTVYDQPASVYLSGKEALTGTDSTSVTVGTGTKTFSNHGAAFQLGAGVGQFVKVWRASDPTVQMIGTIVTPSSTSVLTVSVDAAIGSGTFTDWTVSQLTQEAYNVGGGHSVCFDISNNTTSNSTAPFSGQTRTTNLYATTYGIGTFKSTDGGATWALLNTAGMPNAIIRMVCDPFGVLWALDDDHVYPFNNLRKYDAGWSAMFPTTGTGPATQGSNYTSVAVDVANSPSKPATVVTFIQGDREFVAHSVNGGAAFNNAGGHGVRTFLSPANDVTWLKNHLDYQEANGGAFFANCDACYGPGGKLWTGAEGVWWLTPPTSGQAITLNQQSRGIEQFIGNNILSLPGDGGAVLMGDWDLPAFKTSSFDAYPTTVTGTKGDTQPGLLRGYSFDYAYNDPTFVVGMFSSGDGNYNFHGKSTNKGNPGSWTLFATDPFPGGQGGQIACSDANTYIVMPPGNSSLPKITHDGGATWANIVISGGTPSQYWGPVYSSWTYQRAIESDKGNGDIYFYNVNNGTSDAMYKYTASTQVIAPVLTPTAFSGEKNINEQIRAVPGKTGHMFFTGGFGSYDPGLDPDTNKLLYFTNNGWSSNNQVPGFVEVHSIGCGKAFGSWPYPSLYAAGWRGGVFGIWQCQNWDPANVASGTWTQLGESYPLNIFSTVSCIDGDKVTAGVPYVMTTGMGAFYFADIAGGGSAPPTLVTLHLKH